MRTPLPSRPRAAGPLRHRLTAALACGAVVAGGALATATPVAADTGTATDRLILTPTDQATTSQFVTWRSTSSAPAAVEYRRTGGTAATVAATVTDTIGEHTHLSATLTGLAAGTRYEYRVGQGDDWTPWRTFRTASDAAEPFSFLYYGDAQISLDTTWPAVVQAANAKAPDAVGSVHAGDLIDTASNQTQWTNWFSGMGESAMTTQVLAAPGNHEYSGDQTMRNWKANFTYALNSPTRATIGDLAKLAEGDTPAARQTAAYLDHFETFAGETVYFVDYQDVRFITLNATRNSGFLTPSDLPACSEGCPDAGKLWIDFQAAWLDHVLAINPNTWAVATFHQPVYSVSSGRDEPLLRAAWVPVFEKHDIDLVLQGHDHTYARGYKDTTATGTPGVTSGPVYAVSNSGGKYYTLAPEGENVWTRNGATQVKRGADVSTYQVVTVDGGTLRYESYVAALNGAAPERVGDLYDAFTITKDARGKRVVEDGVEVPAGDAQQLAVTVPEHAGEPGEFVWAIDGSNDLVDLGVAEQAGDHLRAAGALNPVRVTDTRRDAPAWSLSGQVSDFVAGDRVVDGKHLGWAPSATENTGGATPGAAVASGFVSGDGLAEPAVLGSAAAGHERGSVLLGAELDLWLPVSVTEGRYSATLTLTALS
ncbi:purple acid phosphatase family protein [Cellulomonas xiejunii]|uniref:purple acid phosphatase family protein n=1 Tax=Cellulomonas xiejunii TaxID=2968083 RepID=UPI001D0E8A49|nr:metallophosphoesterase family protein [Cellulomonas xiejunii]MCC2314545.1 metallophosphoesterase family protein [Cellulomonas xiejunii]